MTQGGKSCGNGIKGDYHIHTNYSDGVFSPEKIVDLALDAGLQAIALTDHDNVLSYDVAKEYLKTKEVDLKLIQGIEVNTLYKDYEVHILGYFPDSTKSDFKQLLHKLVVVCLVVAVVAAVACTVDARLAIQGEYFQTGIVSKHTCLDVLFAKPLSDSTRLDDGICFEGVAVFNDVVCKADVLERLEFLVLGSKNVGKVPNLSGVSCCDYEQMFHLKRSLVCRLFEPFFRLISNVPVSSR